MSEYKENAVTGTKWQRANRISIINEHDRPVVISFQEEELVTIGDQTIKNPIPLLLEKTLTQEDMSIEFNLMNPTTNEVTGSTMTYAELYAAMHSLYFHLATERDEQE